jgi:two-component system, NtrC family, sensor histidine kinase KinB
MFGIRQKMSFGFGGLFLILCLVGIQSILLLTELGESIDVILRENYRSVIACQDMKEALERMDSAALFALLGHDAEGKSLIEHNRRKFDAALKVELNNITLPGEREQATAIESLFGQYERTLGQVLDASKPIDSRRNIYFQVLLPIFDKVKSTADAVLLMNQANMSEANERARREATSARHRMATLLAIAASLASAFIVLTGKWIFRPITHLTESAEEIRKGNLDLVVHSDSRDEIGLLSRAFNEMAGSLREMRRSDRARLLRVQRSTEQAFRHLPHALAVADLKGKIEVATEIAKCDFDLIPDSDIHETSVERLESLFREAVRTAQPAVSGNGHTLIQRFIKGEERYFRPKAVPILDREKLPTGVILILEDVTQQHREEELKKGVIATVSHQLKTPLTAIRMTIHVLLEERLGQLTEKQADLLLGAREEGERLYSIIEQLLQLSRIESGKLAMNVESVLPHELIFETVEGFSRSAQDRGIALTSDTPPDLPPVQTDRLLVHQVFENLLSNALKYTEPGGRVTVSARADAEFVWFSVADTGRGIPNQYLQRILEQFFRVPGQASDSGVGLGLAIVKQIVDAHGGLVSVESEEGKGSTFTFSLRRSPAPLQEVEHV